MAFDDRKLPPWNSIAIVSKSIFVPLSPLSRSLRSSLDRRSARRGAQEHPIFRRKRALAAERRISSTMARQVVCSITTHTQSCITQRGSLSAMRWRCMKVRMALGGVACSTVKVYHWHVKLRVMQRPASAVIKGCGFLTNPGRTHNKPEYGSSITPSDGT